MSDFAIADILAWARTKRADEPYDYASNRNCAICQFLRETGRCDEPSVGGDYWRDRRLDFHQNPFPEGLERALICKSYGELVAQLEKLCPETVVTHSDWTRLDAYLAGIERLPA